MQLNSKIISLLIGCLFSCNSPEKNKDDDEKSDPVMNPMYKDIDPFSLTGVNEINDPGDYPYIKIEDGKDKKTIAYWITRADSAKTIYEKMGDHWTPVRGGDTGSFRSYEYIFPDKIIELEYFGTYDQTDFHLDNASYMEAEQITKYYFGVEKGLRITPGERVLDSVKDKAVKVITEKMEVMGNMLQVIVSSFNREENKITYTDTSCFSGGKRSWFWFRHFMGHLIPCN